MDAPEIALVRFGSRTTRRSEVFLNHFATGASDGPIGMSYYLWVVRTTDATVLVDTGFAPEAARRRGRAVLIDPVDAAAALGAGPADDPIVVVTHAHYDHIGNLGRYRGCQIIAARRELDFWDTATAARGDFALNVEQDELAALRSARRAGRVREVDDRHEITPGVEAVVVGGHTAGQLVVRVRTSKGGDVVIASDALHYLEELDLDRPFAFTADVDGALRAFDRLTAWRTAGARLLPGHDPGVFGPTTGRPHPRLPEHALLLTGPS